MIFRGSLFLFPDLFLFFLDCEKTNQSALLKSALQDILYKNNSLKNNRMSNRMNNQVFFGEISKSLFNGQISSSQRKGIGIKLTVFDLFCINDKRWQAYMLATSYYETGRTMQPVEETGNGAGKPYGKKLKYDGTVYSLPDRLYFGRGDVQLTWYENYELMGEILDLPLLLYPELALDPEISAYIMVEGMTGGMSAKGDFTGVSLDNYFNRRTEDPFNARRIINGLDQASRIEGFYNKFLRAFESAEWN